MMTLESATNFLLHLSEDNSRVFSIRREGFSSTDTLAASSHNAVDSSTDFSEPASIFPEIQLRDATSDETFLVQFLRRYDKDPLILQPQQYNSKDAISLNPYWVLAKQVKEVALGASHFSFDEALKVLQHTAKVCKNEALRSALIHIQGAHDRIFDEEEELTVTLGNLLKEERLNSAETSAITLDQLDLGSENTPNLSTREDKNSSKFGEERYQKKLPLPSAHDIGSYDDLDEPSWHSIENP